jgi:hypothetical protein
MRIRKGEPILYRLNLKTSRHQCNSDDNHYLRRIPGVDMKVKAIVKLQDGRQVEVVAELEMLSYTGFGGPENPMALEDLQVISIEVVEA